MLENLSERLQGIFSGLRSKGRLTEDDINAAMREIRLALLEADVNFKVVKNFVARTKERCLSAEVLDSLTPAQNVVKIVLDELTELLGRTDSRLVLSSRIPNVIMLVGLQGSGKTTAAAKLAYRLKRENHSPLLIAGDVYRPAAAAPFPSARSRASPSSSSPRARSPTPWRSSIPTAWPSASSAWAMWSRSSRTPCACSRPKKRSWRPSA